MRHSKGMLALSTRGTYLNRLKSQRMSGGVFELIKQIKHIQQLEQVKNRELEKLRILEENEQGNDMNNFSS